MGNVSTVYQEQEAANDFHDGLIAADYLGPQSPLIKI